MPVSVYSTSLTTNDANAGTNFRTFVKLSANSNGQLRVTISASSTTNGLNILGAAFGKWNGTAISASSGDATTAMFRLTFAGSNTVNIAAGATATSDLITHSGLTLSANDWVIIAFYNANTIPTAGQRFVSGTTSATTMFKPQLVDWSQAQTISSTGNGWSVIGNIQPGGSGTNYCVVSLETNDPSGGVSGTLAATETQDAAAFTGAISDNGALAVTEAADVAAFTGTVALAPAGPLAVTEAPDVAAFTANTAISGILTTTEAPDSASFTGTTIVSGALATTEAQDVASFTASYAVTGTLATTEAKDLAAFTASYAVSGILATTESPDIAAFTGSGVTPSGVLAVTEAPDVAAFTGTTITSGTLATTEAKDLAAFTGTVSLPASGILAVIEASDIVLFTGAVAGLPTGALAVTETPDMAAFTVGFVPPKIRASKSPYPSIYDYDWYDGMPPLRGG